MLPPNAGMASVAELSDLYSNFMFAPRAGPGVCSVCFNFTDGYHVCYACACAPGLLDAVAPISYSVAREQLHHVLASYKRMQGEAARRLCFGLAAVLWRALSAHEPCIAAAAGIQAFALVATVPSSDPLRDRDHPLRWIVSELVGPTRARHERLLRRTDVAIDGRAFHARKYRTTRSLAGASVLLIDDTWTTGANARSAAAALKAAGSGPVAVVVIGRHLNRKWHQNDRRLRGIAQPFDWDRCALCAMRFDRLSIVDRHVKRGGAVRPSASR